MSNEAIEEEWQRGNGRARRGASEMTGEPLAPWDLASAGEDCHAEEAATGGGVVNATGRAVNFRSETCMRR